MKVQWTQFRGNKRTSLYKVNLRDRFFDDLEAVFILWYESKYIETVFVGHGHLRKELEELKKDIRIAKYKIYNELYVSWCDVPKSQRAGVVAYLNLELDPLVNNPIEAKLIDVNHPWNIDKF